MKKRILTMTLAFMLSAGIWSTETAEVQAAEAGTAQEETVQENTAAKSLDEETFSALIDFVKEKWDAGALDSKEEIRAAIQEGEEEFQFDLTEDAEEKIIDALEKVRSLGLDSDVIAAKAKELYETYGDAITDEVETVLTQELQKAGAAVSDTLKEQLVEPAKEAAAETAKGVVKNFWTDLKNSVLNFVKNIFHI